MRWSLVTGGPTWRFDCFDQNSSLSLPIVTNEKKIQISFCKNRRKKEDYTLYVKVLPKNFYLNGNTIGFLVTSNLDIKWSRSERDNYINKPKTIFTWHRMKFEKNSQGTTLTMRKFRCLTTKKFECQNQDQI